MPRKPDRFERTVEKAQDYFEALYLDKAQIVKLLRRQHREMVRMVKNMPLVPYLVSERREVIEALKKYAK